MSAWSIQLSHSKFSAFKNQIFKDKFVKKLPRNINKYHPRNIQVKILPFSVFHVDKIYFMLTSAIIGSMSDSSSILQVNLNSWQ